MNRFIRGFVYGLGFVAGATIGGTLIGYGAGKLAEGYTKKLLRQASTSETDKPRDDMYFHCAFCDARSFNIDDVRDHETSAHGVTQETKCDDHKAQYFNSGYEAGLKDAADPQGCTTCGVPHSSMEPHHG